MLFCRFDYFTQKFVLSLPWPCTRVCFKFSRVEKLQGQSSKLTRPVIGPFLQRQLAVRNCRASYWSISTRPVVESFLQRQLSVQIYRASNWFISSGPVIGSFLQNQLPVHPCQPRYWPVFFIIFLPKPFSSIFPWPSFLCTFFIFTLFFLTPFQPL